MSDSLVDLSAYTNTDPVAYEPDIVNERLGCVIIDAWSNSSGVNFIMPMAPHCLKV